MADTNNTKRITFKHTRPNPLFQSWLQELYDEAQEKGSKLEPMLKEALESLSKYPLPLQTGSDCAILKGFGKKLCSFLDTKLDLFNSQSSLDSSTSNVVPCTSSQSDDVDAQNRIENTKPITPKQKSSKRPKTSSTSNFVPCTSSQSDDVDAENRIENTKPITPKQKSSIRPKTYKPAHKSGGYAILIALLQHCRENPNCPTLSKDDLIQKAQPYSEESFTRPKPESHYTAWSNMTRLITKGLITKTRSKKALFSLTNEGLALAEELLKDSQKIPSVNDIIFNDASLTSNVAIDTVQIVDKVTKPSESSQRNNHRRKNTVKVTTGESQNVNIAYNEVNMLAGTFDVFLLIDKAETSGASKKNDPTVAQFKKYPDLKHEYRHLKVGDFTWVARSKLDATQEIVLPFIVERKRMDDLGSSIKDGRFHEQKFRLRKCGLKNVIYLVENYGGNKHVGLPFQSLMQALANTRVQDDFKVHITDSLTNSARFLAMMTKRLTIEYKNKILKAVSSEPKGGELMTFTYFNKSSSKSKTLTITETFIKLLLQIKGMSVEKALAITNAYKTPKALIETYKMCNQKEGEMLLTNLKHGDLNRNVGPTASKVVYQLLTIKDFQ